MPDLYSEYGKEKHRRISLSRPDRELKEAKKKANNNSAHTFQFSHDIYEIRRFGMRSSQRRNGSSKTSITSELENGG